MRRHRIMVTVGDKTYYSYWFKANERGPRDIIALWVRSKSRKFHKKIIGTYTLKQLKP